jgi:type IV pilus assembly protein PilA
VRNSSQFAIPRQKRTWLRGRPENRGFTLIELLIVIAIILIIAAIAIPNLLRSRMAANQAAAVESVRTITTASVVYATTWENGYPPTLAALGGPSSGATCDQASLVDEIITTSPNTKSGYAFHYTGEDGTIPNSPANCGTPGFNGYLVAATPQSAGQTGMNSYCSFTPGVIHYDTSGSSITSEAACDALPGVH